MLRRSVSCAHRYRQPADAEEAGKGKSKTRMYVDESKLSFFRRLAYTPDGKLLITPGLKSSALASIYHNDCAAGRYVNRVDGESEDCDTAYVFLASAPATYAIALSLCL